MSPRRVLIVDPSAESREVLRTLLARRGVETAEAPRPEVAAELAASLGCDLIVVDGDSQRGPEGPRRLAAIAERTGAPLLVLGDWDDRAAGQAPWQRIAKPYHYAPLVHRIEAALCGRAPAA